MYKSSRKIQAFILGFVIVTTLVLASGCKPGSVHPQGGMWTADDIGGPGGDAPITEDGCISLLNGLDPLWMIENGWDLPCPDMDEDGIENECDVDLTLGEDCNSNGIDDSCEIDSDGDGTIDDCDIDDDDHDDCDIDDDDHDDCDIDDDDHDDDDHDDDDHDDCELHDDDCSVDCQDDCHDDSCDDGHHNDDCYDVDGRKVFICHNGRVLHVNFHAVPAHLNHGDTLGTCED
jgi:hypothetical protein